MNSCIISTAPRFTRPTQVHFVADRVDLMDPDVFHAPPAEKCEEESPAPSNRSALSASESGREGLQAALARTRSWRVPSNWSAADWCAESRQIGEVAAWKAIVDYDSAYGLPLERFVYQKVMASVLTQYRRERRFGFRFGSHETSQETKNNKTSQHQAPFSEASDSCDECGFYDDLHEALMALQEPTGWILIQIFWCGYTETEIAGVLGLSQRAISKRKHVGLRNLRKLLPLQPNLKLSQESVRDGSKSFDCAQ